MLLLFFFSFSKNDACAGQIPKAINIDIKANFLKPFDRENSRSNIQDGEGSLYFTHNAATYF